MRLALFSNYAETLSYKSILTYKNYLNTSILCIWIYGKTSTHFHNNRNLVFIYMRKNINRKYNSSTRCNLCLPTSKIDKTAGIILIIKPIACTVMLSHCIKKHANDILQFDHTFQSCYIYSLSKGKKNEYIST